VYQILQRNASSESPEQKEIYQNTNTTKTILPNTPPASEPEMAIQSRRSKQKSMTPEAKFQSGIYQEDMLSHDSGESLDPWALPKLFTFVRIVRIFQLPKCHVSGFWLPILINRPNYH
jgi:hypothetical protein